MLQIKKNSLSSSSLKLTKKKDLTGSEMNAFKF